MKYAILHGSLSAGFQCVGPFDDREFVMDYINCFRLESPQVIELQDPMKKPKVNKPANDKALLIAS